MQNENKDKEIETPPKPDENSGIYIRGHIKIFDPETGEILVSTSE